MNFNAGGADMGDGAYPGEEKRITWIPCSEEITQGGTSGNQCIQLIPSKLRRLILFDGILQRPKLIIECTFKNIEKFIYCSSNAFFYPLVDIVNKIFNNSIDVSLGWILPKPAYKLSGMHKTMSEIYSMMIDNLVSYQSKDQEQTHKLENFQQLPS
jgi:hypothetical protein